MLPPLTTTPAPPRTPLRVLHVVRQFSPSVGGLEDVVLNLARHQRRHDGIDSRVLTLNTLFARPRTRLPSHDVVDGIPVDRLPWCGSSRYPIAPGALAHLRHADILHVHAIDFFVDFLAITRPVHRRPMIVLTHGGIFHTGRQARLKRLWFATITRLSLKAYDATVACSENDARIFARLKPPNLLVIENGADTAKLRSAESIAADPHRLLALGRFAPHKRIETLFPLLAALRRHTPDWTLVVAGVEAGTTLATLQQAARQAGVEAATRFVVGAQDETLKREAATATWFVCASAFEGFGVAAVEAVAAGLIPVLSRIPPFERLLDTLPAGLPFDPENPDQAAAAIIALDQRSARRRPETRAALSRAVEHQDWSTVSGRYAALYAEIIGRRQTPRHQLRPT